MALTNRRKKYGVALPEKNGAQTLYSFGLFSTTSRLNGRYLRKET